MDYRETASANSEETKTQNAILYASSLGEREGVTKKKKTLLIRGFDEKDCLPLYIHNYCHKHIPKFVKTLHLNVDCRIAANVVLE